MTASDYVVLQQDYPTAAHSHQMPHRVREPHDPLLTVRISSQTRAWFIGPQRLGNGPGQRGWV